MVPSVSPSARYLLAIHSNTPFQLQIRPVLTGITRIFVSFTVFVSRNTMTNKIHSATQYCDGLRGPMVVYDPQDPHGHLYSVDDGK